MKKIHLLLAGLLLIIGLAAGGYFWVMGLFSSNYDYRSPLKNNPPAPGIALGAQSTNRVVIVLVDGLRVDTAENAAVMPELNKLRNQGSSAVMHNQPPSFSEAGYSTLMTGAWPEINDGPLFNLNYDQIPTWTQDNLFSEAHRKGIKTAVAGYYWFEKLIPSQDVDFHFYTSNDEKAADNEVINAALPWLKAKDSGLVLIHLDQVDYAGHHSGGPKAKAWNDAATRADTFIGQIAGAMDLNRETLIVLSDHGHIDSGGHGGTEEVVLTEPFVMAGAGVIPGEYRDIQMVDVAPTVAALLGTNLPASTQGEALTFMLNLNSEVANALPGAVQTQQTMLVQAVASSLNMKIDLQKMPTGSDVASYQAYLDSLRGNRVLVQRLERAALIAILLALVVAWLLRNIPNGSLWWISAGLIFLGIFNYKYAYWDQRTYSISSLTGETEFIISILVTSGIAFVIAWLIAALGKRIFWQKPLDSALSTAGLVLTMIFFALLPVMWSFLLNGAVVTWTLPDYRSSFWALLGLVQTMAFGAFGLVAVAVSALLAGLGRRKPAQNDKRKGK